MFFDHSRWFLIACLILGLVNSYFYSDFFINKRNFNLIIRVTSVSRKQHDGKDSHIF